MTKKSQQKQIKRRRTITRGNVRRPEDTGRTTEDLHKLLADTPAENTTPVPDKPVKLKREHIYVAEQVFQWKSPGHNRLPSDDFIIELATAIRRGDVMPPITVFPIGRKYYVMDGHHRLAAHDMAGKKTIEAEVFTGSLKEAARAALRANNKSRTNMSKRDRLEGAWRLVKQEDPEDTIAAIANDSGIATSTVDNMRAALRTLKQMKDAEGELRHPIEDIKALSWNSARLRAKGREEEPDLEDWIEAEAQKLVDDIVRFKLGGRLTKNPDITAQALAKLNADLPGALMAHWAEEDWGEVDENGDLIF